VGQNTYSIAAADFDSDGDQDLATANQDADNIAIFTNSGSGTFAGPVFIGGLPTARSVYAVDLGGGSPDLVVPLLLSDSVALLFNDGTGSFPIREVWPTGRTPVNAIAAQFDSEWGLDLAVANANGFDSINSDNVSVLLHDIFGGYLLENYTVVNHAQHVYPADFEPDGDVDIVVTNWEGDCLSIMANNGDGTFAEAVNYPVADGPHYVAAGDLNNDGFMDLACTNQLADSVSILFNSADSSGSFASPVTYPVGNSPYGAALADYDNDDDLDLAVANFLSNTVTVLLNDGTGLYALDNNYATTSTQAIFIVAADFDNDAYMDLAVANRSGRNVSVLINLTIPTCAYLPGDINSNGQANGIDVTYAVSYLKGGSAPLDSCDCPPLPFPFYAAMDVNGNCAANGIDITFFVSYLKGGQPELSSCPGCQPAAR
jgi:hypothetical protein